MGNRRGNKKLRAATRARMAATGESYQKARARLLAEVHAVDLIECSFYGVPVTLATFQDPLLPRFVVLPRVAQQQAWLRFLHPRGVQ